MRKTPVQVEHQDRALGEVGGERGGGHDLVADGAHPAQDRGKGQEESEQGVRIDGSARDRRREQSRADDAGKLSSAEACSGFPATRSMVRAILKKREPPQGWA